MTWAPVAKQDETWADTPERRARVFSPLVFSLWPVFATGVFSDFWTDKTEQTETWTEA